VNRKLIIFAGLGVALVALPMLSKVTRGPKAKQVETAVVGARKVQSSILASGTLTYREQVQLRSEVIAKVKELKAEEADTVSAGDLIIRLDPETFQAQVEQQEAVVRIQQIAIERQQLQIENLQRRFARNRDLFAQKLVDEDSFEALENQLALARIDLRSRAESLSQAEAGLDQAREQLAKTEIRSPIDGIVIQVDIKVGETVIAGTTNIPGSTLVVIADTSEMLTEVQVDEADIAQVGVGQHADIFPAAFPDQPMSGTVQSIATLARRATGQQSLSFLVKVLLEQPDALAVRPGMSVRADIFTESSENTLAIPVQAVLFDDQAEVDPDKKLDKLEAEQAYVLLIEEEKAVRREVKLGLSSDSDQEILEGLSDGETVISGPYRILRHLKEGDAVTAKEDEAETEDESGSTIE
jgi:HlyD family secretion protein